MDPELLQHLSNADVWISLLTLTVLEVVLGLDNIIFISILVGKLPPEKRDRARRIGLIGAFGMRLGLLSALSWVMNLKHPLFTVLGQEITGKEAVLLLGGLFLLYKATVEIHHKVEGYEEDENGHAKKPSAKAALGAILVQIAILDIVFSLDSVITAVGMVDKLGVMIAAVIASVGVMLFAAKPIGEFVDKHPSVKVLALAFLVMVGMALTAEALDAHVPKGYIYAAMAFSLAVEALNIRARGKRLAAKQAQ